ARVAAVVRGNRRVRARVDERIEGHRLPGGGGGRGGGRVGCGGTGGSRRTGSPGGQGCASGPSGEPRLHRARGGSRRVVAVIHRVQPHLRQAGGRLRGARAVAEQQFRAAVGGDVVDG
ncbi:MAG: hypothetical protein ACK559_11085, partial [bacterium]